MNGTVFTSIANMSCDVGFKDKDGDKTEDVSTTIITCSETGNWTNLPTCIRKDCGNVTYLKIRKADKRRQKNGTEYESTAEIDCDAGFHNKDVTQTSAISTTTITCSDRGTWMNIPTCVPKGNKENIEFNCGQLPLPSNGTIIYVSNTTTFTSKAEYVCDNGYQVNGSDSIKCKDTGFWSDNTTYCQIKDCEQVSPPSNGEIILHQNSTVYGSNASYICDEGYNMKGQANITCEASGSWDYNTTYCEIKDCGMPNVPQDASVSAPNGTKFKAIVEFKCHSGYTLHGDNTTSCMPDGKWKQYTVNCTQNKCDQADHIDHGSVNTTFESRAIYECDIGYTLNGSQTLICQLDGTWDSEPPTCNVTDCGEIIPPIQGSVSLILNETTFNATAMFNCETGYELTDDKMARCNASGLWTSNPECKIKGRHFLLHTT
ncbi:P-selectin-like [Ruditapes philippinarum]|uniref:P-selectin-like n=1 Tax=Ruditapes philippinarum TaxID=129788 RepID=UPI00295BC039|nr:P-selectin-like [Ruditapes philippinarum]